MKIENRREKKKHQRINQAKPSLHVKRKKKWKTKPSNVGATALGCFSPCLFSQVLFPILSLKKRKKRKGSLSNLGRKYFGVSREKTPRPHKFFFSSPSFNQTPTKKVLSYSLSLSKIHPTKYTLNVTLKNPSNLEKDTFLSISSLQSDQEIASLFCNHTLLSFLPIGLKQTKQWAKNFVPISNFIVCESNVHYPLWMIYGKWV